MSVITIIDFSVALTDRPTKFDWHAFVCPFVAPIFEQEWQLQSGSRRRSRYDYVNFYLSNFEEK